MKSGLRPLWVLRFRHMVGDLPTTVDMSNWDGVPGQLNRRVVFSKMNTSECIESENTVFIFENSN